jgi:two-component system alkaline phosphatase synthesis response regulator PhoP
MARILVIDDEPDILLMLRMTLEDEGHDVVIAADGASGLQRLDEDHPDLVLCDVMMPVLDGWGVLERMQRDGETTPVIVLSAKTDKADLDRAMSLGATDYVTKPFDLDRVVALVAAVLARR